VDGATGADTGVATSMNNASLQIGSAIGLAAPVSVGTSHATSLWHAGIDATTATAAHYALSFAFAAGVTGFGARLRVHRHPCDDRCHHPDGAQDVTATRGLTRHRPR
jgi:hypothetical protein